MNGRTNSDEKESFTFVSTRGCSTIDYILADSLLFKVLIDFSVLNNDLSLHFPISCTIKLNTNLGTNNNNSGRIDLHELPRYKWCETKAVVCGKH